jgi:monoamine oxidase
MPIRQSNTNAINRRTFGVASASLVMAPAFSSRALAYETADVIVIGAGLAGLSAALNLESQGLKVIVLEAADYVGGRTKTLDLPVGPTNSGGQTVGPYYARLRDFITRLNVPVVPVPRRIAMGNYVNGSLESSTAWKTSKANKLVGPEREVQPDALEFFYVSRNNPLKDPADWMEPEYAKYDIGMDQYLRSQGASDEAIRLINFTINAPNLASCSALGYLRDIALLQWGVPKANSKTQSTYQAGTDSALPFNEIAGGTQRLPEAMGRALKGDLLLNKTVMSIDMSQSGVEVTTLDGARYKGKYVISSVPFSALKNIEINPDFTGRQREAVQQSLHGNTVRVFLEFTSPFWESDTGQPSLFTDTSIERVFARVSEAGEIYALDCWMNGNAANRVDQLPAEIVGQFVIDELARIRPSTKGKLKFLRVHSWAKHSPSGCCRHVFGPGQIAPWAGLMATPHGRLHLAGEQTRSMENGMEAAATSGERAAYEVLERES